jgi:uncharacterized protein YbjT (DUF2867 family)
MRILVTGASGSVGSVLVPRLLSDGHMVRALGRDPARVSKALARGRPPAADSEAEILRGDALTGEGLSRALEGVEVAYYLIHSMERPPTSSPARDRSRRRSRSPDPSSVGPFQERERIAADTFAAAAVLAGVRRIVYLGGLAGRGHPPASRHLASRQAVERILLDAVPDSVALRASIVIGAHSRSFRFLVHLVERLPVLTLPRWRDFHTQPIDGRDITEMLTASATAAVAGRSLDVGGPDVLTYGEMMARIAEVMLVHRPSLGFGLSVTPLAARLAAAIAGEEPELVLPLMEGLGGDLLPADDHAGKLFEVELHSFESAVEHALGEWEASEPLAAR